MEEKLIVVDFQPLMAAAFALQNQRAVSCLLQVEAEAAAAVGGSQNSGLRGQGGDVNRAELGAPMPVRWSQRIRAAMILPPRYSSRCSSDQGYSETVYADRSTMMTLPI